MSGSCRCGKCYQSTEAEQWAQASWWLKAFGVALVACLLAGLYILDVIFLILPILRPIVRGARKLVWFVRYRGGCVLRGEWREAVRVPRRYGGRNP